MVEDIFALTVRLQIEGHDRRYGARLVANSQMLGRPACALGDAARFLKDIKKVVGDKRVGCVVGGSRASVPLAFSDFGNAPMNTDLGPEAHHAAKPSKIRLSQWSLTASHWAGSRTVQAITGIPDLRRAVALGCGNMSMLRARK